jgi:hypothetical protein
MQQILFFPSLLINTRQQVVPRSAALMLATSASIRLHTLVNIALVLLGSFAYSSFIILVITLIHWVSSWRNTKRHLCLRGRPKWRKNLPYLKLDYLLQRNLIDQ